MAIHYKFSCKINFECVFGFLCKASFFVLWYKVNFHSAASLAYCKEIFYQAVKNPLQIIK